MGLDQNSHIIVFCWFQKSDTPEKRKTLQVHPRGNKANPLTGVFATRSPVRPNPISISACKILSIDGRLIHVDDIDAFDGTPVVDIKPYVPRLDAISGVKMPEWAEEKAHE
jgi:tRNA-Thr(GGU) m(6)t(6)A37 methyltransferase TsaA